jgi:hypothetical protein
MTCSKCANYSRQLSRCKLGKIIPRTLKGGREAVQWMGLSYICQHWSKYDNFVSYLAKNPVMRDK